MSTTSLPSALGFSVIALLLFLFAMVVVVRCCEIKYWRYLGGPGIIGTGEKLDIK